MDNNNNFGALIEAIKASSKPTEELAKLLQDKFKPVVQSKLRNAEISKLNVGSTSYEVCLNKRHCNGDSVILEYDIKNEIATDQGCVTFVKGMIHNIYNIDYALTKAVECGNKLFITFTAPTDKVLIE